MSWTLYKHTSPSGKVYIGITGRRPSKRWDNGHGYKHSPHMAAAIEKYGWDSFDHVILESGLTREEASAAEVREIARYRSDDRRYGYNVSPGGYAPDRISEETREKMRQRMIGDQNPTKRFGHPMLGKHHSEASKMKMSASAKARTGRYVSPETKAKLREAQKKRPVIDLTTGATYDGLHEAAEAAGVEATKVCAVCKGKRRSAKGHIWKYLEVKNEQ